MNEVLKELRKMASGQRGRTQDELVRRILDVKVLKVEVRLSVKHVVPDKLSGLWPTVVLGLDGMQRRVALKQYAGGAQKSSEKTIDPRHGIGADILNLAGARLSTNPMSAQAKTALHTARARAEVKVMEAIRRAAKKKTMVARREKATRSAARKGVLSSLRESFFRVIQMKDLSPGFIRGKDLTETWDMAMREYVALAVMET